MSGSGVFNATGNSNVNAMKGFQAYSPQLQGATNDPVATLSTQVGRFYILGNAVFFGFTLVSTTMTKSTLTDALRITLPIAAATNAGHVWRYSARVENATAVSNALAGEIASASSFSTFRNYAALATNSAQTTYQVADPGIGVLTNTITFNGAGFYEF